MKKIFSTLNNNPILYILISIIILGTVVTTCNIQKKNAAEAAQKIQVK